MVLIPENSGEQELALVQFLELGDCRLLVQLEGDDKIGLQVARKLAGHHHGIAAVGTFCRTGGPVGHDLAAAGLAGVDPQALGLAGLPFASGGGVPGHFIGLLLLGLDGFHVKFRAAVGTLHFLYGAVELDGTVTAGAFILLQN